MGLEIREKGVNGGSGKVARKGGISYNLARLVGVIFLKIYQEAVMRKVFTLVLSLVLASAGLALAAQAKKVSNKDVVQGFYRDVINKHNVDAIDDYAAKNIKDHNPDPGQKPGAAGLKESFAEFFKAFPDAHIQADFILEEGDKVVARVTMTGTQKGEFMGMPASKKRFKISGIDIVRIQNGKAVERWGNFDMAAMMQQVGMGAAMGASKDKCPMTKDCPMGKDGKCSMKKGGKECKMGDMKGKKDKKEDKDEDDDN